MNNLLQNGDFTADWGEQGSHRAWVCKPGETPQIAQIGNIFSPPGWDTWFRHEPNVWDQPEVRDARSDDRLYEGHKAQLLFTFYRKHWGGFLQVVPTVPGRRYRLTAWAHAWSNSKDGPHPDDPRWSEGSGYEAGYISPPLAEGAPPPIGSPGTTDDWRNFAFNCGLDPTGGVDPFAQSLVWGTGASIYNQYGQVPAVEATATGERMTVFLRSRTLWPFKHNDSYWGAALLQDVTPEPEPQHRGQPRVQYERTYVLLPPDARGQWVRAIGEVWDAQRYTIGGSADDAGVGSLDVRRVLAVNPQRWGGDLQAFFEQYYPGVEYTPVQAASPADLAVQLCEPFAGDIALSQRDARWVRHDLGNAPAGPTIGQSGCLLTVLAMMLRQAYQRNVTPDVLNQLLVDADVVFVSDDLLMWADAIALFGKFTDSQKVNRLYTAAQLAQLLADGWLVGLARSDLRHFVYLERVVGNSLDIIDPWDGQRKAWTTSQVGGIRAARLTQDGGEQLEPEPEPQPEPPVDTDRSFPTLHLQTFAPGAAEFIRDAKPLAVKGLAGQQDWLGVMRECRDSFFIWRHHGGQHESLSQATPRAAAQKWISYWIDSLHHECDRIEQTFPGIQPPYMGVESWNEIYACNDSRLDWFIEADRCFIEELHQAEPRVAAVVFNAPVGNPGEWEYHKLIPLAKTAAQYGAFFGAHSYWFGNKEQHGMTDEHWPWLQGRWTEIDKTLVAAGHRVKWFLGESGLVGGRYYSVQPGLQFASILSAPVAREPSWAERITESEAGAWREARMVPVRRPADLGRSSIAALAAAEPGGTYWLNPGSGWKDTTDCIGGDWNRYLAEILEMRRRIAAWNKTHEDRCYGFAIFTTAAYSYMGWGHFGFDQPQMESLAAAL